MSARSRSRSAVVAVLALVATMLLAPPAQADQAVDPGGDKVFRTIGDEHVVFGDYMFFAADDDRHGLELWRTDGTPAGTQLVKDFNPGGANTPSYPQNLVVAGGRLYVQVDRPGGLWVLDTPTSEPREITFAQGGASAHLKKGFALGDAFIGMGYAGLGHSPSLSGYLWYRVDPGSTTAHVVRRELNLTHAVPAPAVLGKYAYFPALDTSYPPGTQNPHGYELWRTDGTAAGTTLVKDINPGRRSSHITHMTATSDRIYFTADDGVHGKELWTSDGTAAGTRLVRDHRPGTQQAPVQVTTSVGNVLFYVVNDHQTGTELWRTDGTPAGTRVVKDISPGPQGAGMAELVSVGSKVFYLRQYRDLWVSDGTEAGTKHVVTLDRASHGLTPAFGKVYFAGYLHPWRTMLWRTSGTPASTFPLATGGFAELTNKYPTAEPMGALGTRFIYSARFDQPTGSPYRSTDRKIYYIDTTKPDAVQAATKRPTLKGKKRVGERLRVNTGTWRLTPVRTSIQWYAGKKAIPGATSATLPVKKAHRGKKVSARVTTTAIGAPLRTVATKKVRVKGTLKVRKKPRIKGKARVGATLRAVKPKVKPKKGVKLSYQWYAGKKKIKKAKKARLKLTAKHRGKRIHVRVTVKKKHFAKVTVKSAKTKKVKRR